MHTRVLIAASLLAKAAQGTLFGALNPELRAEKRVDKRGHVVTRYVKREDAPSAQGSLFEPPAAPPPTPKPERAARPPAPTAPPAPLFSFDYSVTPEPPPPDPTPTPTPAPREIARHQDGLPEKRTAKLLRALKLAAPVLAEPTFHAVVRNPPFLDLHVERVDASYGRPAVALTHFGGQGGDAFVETEAVYALGDGGALALLEVAVAGPNGEHRAPDRAFAGIFARNLLDQGFDEGAVARTGDVEPVPPAENPTEHTHSSELAAYLERLQNPKKLAYARAVAAHLDGGPAADPGDLDEDAARKIARKVERLHAQDRAGVEAATAAQAAHPGSTVERVVTEDSGPDEEKVSQVVLAAPDGGTVVQEVRSQLGTGETELGETRARPPLVGLPEGATPAQRRAWNDAAVTLLDTLRAEGRAPTDDERALLGRYSGNGGVGASLNEFYTPPALADALWQVLRKLGAAQGRGLEPSCGPGVLVQGAPDGAALDAVELSPISAGIAGHLFGDRHAVHNMPFEAWSTAHPSDERDFVIGNPPFGPRGATAMLDEPDIKECARYFTLKSLDHLREGGVAVLVLPHGVARGKPDAEIRRRILARAEVLAIHGLPASAFADAGTEDASTDVWVLRGRPRDLRAALEATGSDGFDAIGEWDPAFIDGRWHDAHPEQLHGTHGTNNLGWYRRGGEFTPDVLAAVVERTPAPQSDGATLAQLVDALERRGNNDALARVNTAAIRADGRKEGQTRLGADGQLQVCRGGKWRNVDAPVGAAFVQGRQLSDLLGTHASLLASGDLAGANDLRAQIERLLREYVAQHGNPHDGEVARLARGNADLNPLLAAIAPDGTLAPAYTRDAARAAPSFDPLNVGEIVGHLRRAQGRATTRDVLTLYGRHGQTEEGVAKLLAGAGFALREDGTWVPDGEYYAGNPFELEGRIDVALARTGVSDWAREALERQKAEVWARAKRRPLEDLAITPRSPFAPAKAVHEYVMEHLQSRGFGLYGRQMEIKRDGDALTVEPNGYLSGQDKKALNFAQRYLTGKGRRADEADLYRELDEGFTAFLSERGHREAVEDAYFQATAWLDPQWDATPLDSRIPGWNPNLKLRPWQNEAANRALAQGSGIVALDVGLGKTFTGIALTLKSKADGVARKPVIAVPKSVVSKWRADVLTAKPGARILVVGSEPVVGADGQPARDEDGEEMWREVSGATALDRQLARVNAEDWDVILMTHETLGRIPMSDARLLELLESEFSSQRGEGDGADYFDRPGGITSSMWAEYTRRKAQALLASGDLTLADLESAGDKVKRLDAELREFVGKKNLSPDQQRDKAEKKRARAEAVFLSKAAAQLSDTSNDLATTWESLGIDHLVVDEAHGYKGLWEPSGRLSAKYLGAGQSSQRATDLYYKTRDMRARTGGRGIHLLTATPIKNSPVELYNMLCYSNPDLLRARGIRNVDAFIERYCDIEEQQELDENGDTRSQPVLVGLKNLTELREFASVAINRRTAQQVGLPLPEEDAAYHLINPTDEQAETISWIAANPLQALRDYMGQGDIPDGVEGLKETQPDTYAALMDRFRLSVAHLLRRAELDLEMLHPASHQGYVSPKVRALLDDVKRTVGQGQKAVVFCDAKDMPHPEAQLAGESGARNPHGYSFHEKLRRLIAAEAGIDPSEVAIANADTAKDPDSRLEISRGLASGKYKVVLGNTATMGQGMDLQKGVENLMHLDVPWNPADLQQRNGRVLRQGNTSARVQNRFYMGTRGLDRRMLDILRGKTNWYEEFWNGTGDTIENNAVSTIPSQEEIQAVAIADEAEREAALRAITEREQSARAAAARVGTLKAFGKYTSLVKALDKHRSDLGESLTPKSRAVRDRLVAQVASTRARLEADPHFAPYAAFLERPQRAIIDAASGRAFETGQKFFVASFDGDQTPYVVHGYDPKKGAVQLREVGPDGQPARGALRDVPLARLAQADLDPWDAGHNLRLHVRARGARAAGIITDANAEHVEAGLRDQAARDPGKVFVVRRDGRLTHTDGAGLRPGDEFALPHRAADKRDIHTYLNSETAILGENGNLIHRDGTAHRAAAEQGFDVSPSRNERGGVTGYMVKAAPTIVVRSTSGGRA